MPWSRSWPPRAAPGAGVFVLVRTSNPGAAEIQDVSPGGGPPLRDRLAGLVHELGADGVGDEGLSDVGAVVAATEPALLAALRERMPHAVLLLPGRRGAGRPRRGSRRPPSPGGRPRRS